MWNRFAIKNFILSAFVFCIFFSEVQGERQEVKLYQDDIGIWMESKFLTMHVGGLIQVDGDYFTNTNEGNSTFVLRRARIFLEGNIYDMFYYLVTGRWDFWTARVHDTYINTLGPKWAQVRIGYTKVPFSMENLYSDPLWEFTEKSIATTNFIFRDTGLQVYGKILEDYVEYHVGLYNGVFAAADNNNSKDVVGRVVLTPLLNSGFFCGRLDQLYFGASGLIGKQTTNLTGTQFITGSGNTNGAGIPFFTFGGTTAAPVRVNAQRMMWGADCEWLYGPYAIRAEYLNINWGNINRTLNDVTTSSHFMGHSWFVEGTYNLTGEVMLRNKVFIPNNNFEWGNWGGAWQLVARYEQLHINSNIITSGLATGANEVSGFTVGVNWILNPFVLTRLDWQYLNFNHRIPVSSHFIHMESLVTARIQTAF